MKILKEIYRHPLLKVSIGIIILAFFGAVLTQIFEAHKNEQFQALEDAIWWVLVTMTTVGYGDKVPITFGGRIIGVFIMFSGLALVSLFTATISSIFIARQIKEGRGLEQINEKNHLVICGWNFNGEQILASLDKKLKSSEAVVLINLLTEESIADIIGHYSELKIKYVHGDFTKEAVLMRANIKAAEAVIILPDSTAGMGSASDERTILATLSIKALNPKTKVYAHIIDRENLSHMRKAKADDVLLSDAYAGYLLAAHVLSPGIPQTVDLLFGEDNKNMFIRYDIPNSYIGKNYGEIRTRLLQEKNALVIGIGKEQKVVNLSDILSDDYSYLDQYIMRKFEAAGRGLRDENKINIQINPPADIKLGDKDFLILISSGEKI